MAPELSPGFICHFSVVKHSETVKGKDAKLDLLHLHLAEGHEKRDPENKYGLFTPWLGYCLSTDLQIECSLDLRQTSMDDTPAIT